MHSGHFCPSRCMVCNLIFHTDDLLAAAHPQFLFQEEFYGCLLYTSSGKFVKDGDYWIYRYDDKTIAKNVFLKIDKKTYYLSLIHIYFPAYRKKTVLLLPESLQRNLPADSSHNSRSSILLLLCKTSSAYNICLLYTSVGGRICLCITLLLCFL